MTIAQGAVLLIVELVLLVFCTGWVSVRQDVLHRQLHKGPRPRVDAVIKAATRCVFILGGFMGLLALSVCGPDFFAASYWSLALFLQYDFFSIKTALHGCFLIGGYANWTMTGNMRYSTLMLTVMLAIAVPAATFFVLTAAAASVSAGDCWIQASLSALLLVLCLSVLIAVWQARSAVFTSDSVEVRM